MKKCSFGGASIRGAFFLLLLFVPTLAVAEPVRIGIISDLSGRASYWGSQSRLGAELAVEELKQRGIATELFFEDTVLDTKKAVSAAHKLLFFDKVNVLYSEFTAISTAISPVVRNQKRLLVYSAAANSLVESNPYAFKTYLDYIQGCKRVAEYWKTKGFVKVAILKATAEFGELCAIGVREIYPKLFETSYAYGDDVATQALLIKKHGAEAVINATYEGDFINMLKAMEAIQYKPFVAGNADAVTIQVMKQFSGFSSHLIRFGFAPIAEDFLDKVKRKDPDNDFGSIEAAALTYTHMIQIAAAVHACPDRDTACLMEQLAKSSADTTLGFKGWNERLASFDIRVSGWRDGKEISLQ